MLNAGNTWLVTATYYDNEYRIIQSNRALYDLGSNVIERVSYNYKFNLAAVVAEEKTEQVSGNTTLARNTKTFTYDHADRLLNIKESVAVAGSPAGTKTKEAYTLAQRYNKLGQLRSKWFHGYTSNLNKYRRKIDYTNNIRGWLTSANSYLSEPAQPFYGIKLNYMVDDKYTNGNIMSMRWGSNTVTPDKG